jgi:ribonuclease P protein subunit POP4
MNEVMRLLRGELIGLSVDIPTSHPEVHGTIVNETKETFTIQTPKGAKSFIKRRHIFVFDRDGKKIRVNGALLSQRPEDRIKIRAK